MTDVIEKSSVGRSATAAVAVRLLTSVMAGFVVLLLLFPFRGVDPDPPVCYSVFGYVVPCGAGLSLAAGFATAVLLGFVLFAVTRRS